MDSVTIQSPAKVNLLLNILGKRGDGFHELETVMHPVAFHDTLVMSPGPAGVQLTCSDDSLPVDETNLVYRAAAAFLSVAKLQQEGVHIALEKRIPQQAGMGGGSGDAASTLRGMNRLFGEPLSSGVLQELASSLGSDVPFFLQSGPALATGRGEVIKPLEPFPALEGKYFLLFHPGFGVSTGWAYSQLARHEECLHGTPGRARDLVDRLQHPATPELWDSLYNSFEKPVFQKFPVLKLMVDFLMERGARVARMSGSGSAIFAIVDDPDLGKRLCGDVCERYGIHMWNAVVPANGEE